MDPTEGFRTAFDGDGNGCFPDTFDPILSIVGGELALAAGKGYHLSLLD